jgi:hypothetical protein
VKFGEHPEKNNGGAAATKASSGLVPLSFNLGSAIKGGLASMLLFNSLQFL